MGMLIFFVTFLVPRLQTLLNSLGGRLPFATRVLIDTAHLMVAYGPLALVALALAVAGLVWWWKTPAGRLWSDRAVLRTPLFGPLVIESTIQGFSETLAVLLENGVTTVDALTGADDRKPLDGSRLSAPPPPSWKGRACALAKVPFMPDYVVDALIVGENTGKLAPHLRDLSESMKEEIAQRLNALTSIISTSCSARCPSSDSSPTALFRRFFRSAPASRFRSPGARFGKLYGVNLQIHIDLPGFGVVFVYLAELKADVRSQCRK